MKVGNSTLQMTPTCVTFKGNAIRLNDGPAKKPNDLMNDVVNLAGIAFGVLEEVGGIPEDEVGVGEAVQVDGAERIVRDIENLRNNLSSLNNIRVIKTGRLKSYQRGNFEVKGNNRMAKKVFKKLTGREPKSSFDRESLNNDKEIVYRANSKSGPSKIEIVDKTEKSLLKITFKE